MGFCPPLPHTRSAPLPLVGWGWGWGSQFVAPAVTYEPPPPSPPLPHKGGGSRPSARQLCASFRRSIVRAYRTLNVLQHAIDVREHVVVPVPQHAIAIALKSFCALSVDRRSHSMLPTIDLHNDAFRMACEIDDVASDLNLPPEMRARRCESVPQMPPQFALRFSRRSTHFTRAFSLPRRPRAITDRPNARLVLC